MYLPLAMRAMEETGNKLRPLMAIYKIKSASDFRKFYRFSQYEQQTGCRFKEDNGRALRLLQLVYEKCKVYNVSHEGKGVICLCALTYRLSLHRATIWTSRCHVT
jgi:hypothetical protein